MASTWSVPGYEEIRELGAGATGRVVLARHLGTGRPVAIKYLARQLVREPGFLERFRSEAETLARLRDPHVVRIFDYVESREGAAIVMEAVVGPTLRGLLVTHGPCPPEVALTVLQGSLLGLAAAHAQGVVHRDYKPENVLVDAAGESKLADFGVAAPAGRDVAGHGTPAYMAPEQWNRMRATPATDIYAASVVFFEMLAGQRPFSADTMSTRGLTRSTAGLRAAHEAAPVPLERVPEPVRPLLVLGLSKNPEQRYQDVPSFLAHLERVAVAGYGPDWKERGTRDLAAAVAAMIAAFPLLALGGGGNGGGAGAGAAAPGYARNAVEVARQGFEGAEEVSRRGVRAGRSGTRFGARIGRSAVTVKVVAAAAGLAAVFTTTTVVVANIAPAGQPGPVAASTASPLRPTGSSAPSSGGVPSASSGTSAPSSDTASPTTSVSPSPSLTGSMSSSSSSSSSASSSPSMSSHSSPSSGSASSPETSHMSSPSTSPTTSVPSATPTPTPTTSPAPVPSAVSAVVGDPALVGSSSMCSAKTLHVSVTGTISYSGGAPASVTYVWTRSDGTHTAPRTAVVTGGSATVTDQFGAGADGWDQLSVGTVTSTQASYTVNCVTGKLSAQNTTATGCATTPGNVYFTGTVSGKPGTTVRWYWYLAFSTGTPTSAQGKWASVTLDARGSAALRFSGWSDFSNTITGTVMVDPMDGGKPFQLSSAVGTLTCR